MVFSSRGFRLLHLGKIFVSKREDRGEETEEKRNEEQTQIPLLSAPMSTLMSSTDRPTDRQTSALDALAQRHIYTYTYESS